MSLKKVGEVKSDKGFKIWDLLIYGIIIVLAAVIFIVVFLTENNDPLTGVKIFVGSEKVFDYNFEKREYECGKGCEILRDDQGELELKITEDGKGYNIVLINKGGYVDVTDADCRSLDCVYSPKIEKSGDAIYCWPHGLRIIPYGYDSDNGNFNM